MGVELREARNGDESTVADIHVRAWQEAYRGLIPDEFLDTLEPEDRARSYNFGSDDPAAPTTLLAVQEGEDCGEVILGFVTFCRSRDADAPDHGEIAALYVDPDRYEGGVGRMLMAEARRRLWEAGFTDALLWVLEGNDRAIRFYENEGWTLDGATRAEEPYEVVSQVRRLRRPL
jgi:GNAT superfamily N-acetyltransferase